MFTQMSMKRAPNPLYKEGKELATCGDVILRNQIVKDLSNQKWRYMQEHKDGYTQYDMHT